MKVLFTGAGSIGSRHIKNLTDVCNSKRIPLEIDVIRYSERILPDEIKSLVCREIRNDSDLRDEYDVLFVTDETKSHYDNILKYKQRCHHMFIEKPILDDVNYDLDQIRPDNNSIYYVACPIRFSNYYQEIKKIVNENEIYSARIIFSSYMPNWQKGRDYRKSFRCSVARGGGVDIDSLHEIDYMTSLFGYPDKVCRVAGKYSGLEMDACDIATYIFTYKDKLVEMHLDYFGRTNNRRIELFAKDDVIVIDFNKQTVEKQLAGTKITYERDDQFYQKEMDYFVTLIQSDGKMENINPVDNAFMSLKIAKGF